MSMNLYFGVKGTEAVVDFHFQTSTDLTMAVLAVEDTDQRLQLIESKLILAGWTRDQIDSTMAEVRALMEAPSLELFMM